MKHPLPTSFSHQVYFRFQLGWFQMVEIMGRPRTNHCVGNRPGGGCILMECPPVSIVRLYLSFYFLLSISMRERERADPPPPQV